VLPTLISLCKCYASDASVVYLYAVVVCLTVFPSVCHKLVFYWNS